MISWMRLLVLGAVLLVLNLVVSVATRHSDLGLDATIFLSWLAQVLFWTGIVCLAVGLFRSPAARSTA